jgi:hypothetical protein
MRPRSRRATFARRHIYRFSLCLVLVGVTLAAQTSAAAPPPAQGRPSGAPLAGQQEGPIAPVSTAVACTRNVTVLIQVYQFFSEPSSNGCWGYNRSYQNAGQGMNNWTICLRDGSHLGSGPNHVYDDTSPAQALSGENSRINGCGNLYGEDMARRSQLTSENWCTNHGYPNPCWRRNAASVSVARYFAELYSDDSSVDNYYPAWTATGNGANPTNSFGIWNIRPIVFNNVGTTSTLFNKVVGMCQIAAAHGGYFSIYAGAAVSGALTVTQTDVNTFSSAMNSCTTS